MGVQADLTLTRQADLKPAIEEGSMHWIRVMAIVAAVVALSGCQMMGPPDPTTLNLALKAPATNWTATKQPASCIDMDLKQTCLLPGMILEIQQTSAESKNNIIIPVLTRFSWTVPRPDGLTQSDLFVLSYIASAAHLGGTATGSASACLEAWLAHSSEFRDQFYVPLLQKSTIAWKAVNPAKPANSAIAVQAWMRQLPVTAPPGTAPPAPLSRQIMTLQFPPLPADAPDPRPCANESFTVFDHGSAWQTLEDDPGVTTMPPFPSNGWFYRGGLIENPRTFLTVLVPVSLGGTIRHVPIDSSLADIEQLIGLEVASVSRVASLAPANVKLSASTPRFSIKLTDSNWFLPNSDVVEMPHGCVADILVAPGDEIYFGANLTFPSAVGRSSCLAN